MEAPTKAGYNKHVFVEELPAPPAGAVAVKLQLRPDNTTLEHAKDSKVCENVAPAGVMTRALVHHDAALTNLSQHTRQ